jgi:hypothetical protein
MPAQVAFWSFYVLKLLKDYEGKLTQLQPVLQQAMSDRALESPPKWLQVTSARRIVTASMGD